MTKKFFDILPPGRINKKIKLSRRSSIFQPSFSVIKTAVAKIAAILIIISLNWSGFSAISKTLAYFNDTENSISNSLTASSLDFILTPTSWVPEELNSGDIAAKSIIVSNVGGLDFQYNVRAVNFSGNLCSHLNLIAELNGVQKYSGPLISFSTSTGNFNFEAPENWIFSASFNQPGLDGETCDFDFIYDGWQNEFLNYGDGGFFDTETSHNIIRAGESKAPNECPFADGQGKYVVYFNDKVLVSSGDQNAATEGPVVGFLPADTYDITLASYDQHSIKPDQIQPNEQWKLILKNAAGTQIAVTNSIRDIVDATEEQVIEKVETNFNIAQNIYLFTAFHSAYPNSNPNSLQPLCALFEGQNLPPQIPGLVSFPSGRVGDGLLALYTFEENSGQAVWDVSGVGVPLNLWIPDLTKVSRVSGGLSIDSSTIISSFVIGTKLIKGIPLTNEITMEAWVKPKNLDNYGPARIMTLSQDTGQRDFTLGQHYDSYIPRLRTTVSGLNGVWNGVNNNDFFSDPVVTTDLSHVVYTRDSSGNAKIYVNGVLAGQYNLPGDLSNWANNYFDNNYRFGLANEFTMDRTWLGEMHLVAVYNRALSETEVLQNFNAGADTKIVINEFLPNPIGDDNAAMPNGEWVELYNTSNSDFDVSGWMLYDANDSRELAITNSNTNTGNTIVPSHGWLIVYLNGAYSGWLNNTGGDTVRLYNGPIATSKLIDSHTYTIDAAENKSFARIPDGTGNWVDPIPTPGGPNILEDENVSIIIPEEPIIINEPIIEEPALEEQITETEELATTGETATTTEGVAITEEITEEGVGENFQEDILAPTEEPKASEEPIIIEQPAPEETTIVIEEQPAIEEQPVEVEEIISEPAPEPPPTNESNNE